MNVKTILKQTDAQYLRFKQLKVDIVTIARCIDYSIKKLDTLKENRKMRLLPEIDEFVELFEVLKKRYPNNKLITSEKLLTFIYNLY